MPTHGQYRPRVEGSLNEAGQRYMAAVAAYTQALLDQDVVARSITRTATCPSPR
jgi:hypothetical protein